MVGGLGSSPTDTKGQRMTKTLETLQVELDQLQARKVNLRLQLREIATEINHIHYDMFVIRAKRNSKADED